MDPHGRHHAACSRASAALDAQARLPGRGLGARAVGRACAPHAGVEEAVRRRGGVLLWTKQRGDVAAGWQLLSPAPAAAGWQLLPPAPVVAAAPSRHGVAVEARPRGLGAVGWALYRAEAGAGGAPQAVNSSIEGPVRPSQRLSRCRAPPVAVAAAPTTTPPPRKVPSSPNPLVWARVRGDTGVG
jgi:hypothetical protein